MRLPQLAVARYATPGDYISHLGPRPTLRADEGPLTLCGLYLAPMQPVPADDDEATHLRPCAMCADLERADVWTHEPPVWAGGSPDRR